jgi:hypothetical protein
MVMDGTFHFRDGRQASNILEFLKILEHLDRGTFEYHRNHFYDWLKDCIDPRLAEELKDKAQDEMVEHLKGCL